MIGIDDQFRRAAIDQIAQNSRVNHGRAHKNQDLGEAAGLFLLTFPSVSFFHNRILQKRPINDRPSIIARFVELSNFARIYAVLRYFQLFPRTGSYVSTPFDEIRNPVISGIHSSEIPSK